MYAGFCGYKYVSKIPEGGYGGYVLCLKCRRTLTEPPGEALPDDELFRHNYECRKERKGYPQGYNPSDHGRAFT